MLCKKCGKDEEFGSNKYQCKKCHNSYVRKIRRGEITTKKSLRFKEMPGRRIENFVVIEFSKSKKSKSGKIQNYWKCLCDCGNIFEINTYNASRTKSCGCLKAKGETNSKWRGFGKLSSRKYNIYKSSRS